MKLFIKESLAVMFGGGFGTLARYFVCYRLQALSFSIVILIINLAGCFVGGLLLGLLEKRAGDISKSFIFIGFIGAFSTFADLSLIFNGLILEKEYLAAIVNVLVSVLVGLFTFSLGYFFAKKRFPV